MAIHIVLFVLMLSVFGCASSAKAVEGTADSGFLKGYYENMQAGGAGESHQVYRAATATKYSRVLIESVTIYYGDNSKMKDLPGDQLQGLADLFAGELASSLSKDYEIANVPGPETLWIRVAITDADAKGGMLRTVRVVPWLIPGLKFAVFKTKDFLFGKPVMVGDVTAEVKVTDAQSGEVLFAAVDERIGGSMGHGWKSWDDVRGAFEVWAEKIRVGLKNTLETTATTAP